MLQAKKVVIIYSGDYYVSNDPEVVLCTVLGSCIAVCLYDDRMRIGGMNHFMLPRAWQQHFSEYGRFGLESMEIMLAQFYKMGANHSNLKAKVFGGARMIESPVAVHETDVAAANVNFIIDYLKRQQITLVARI